MQKNTSRSLSPDVKQGDYYNVTAVKYGSEVEGSIYELPQREGNDVGGSNKAVDVYQSLDKAATGSDLQTPEAVYEDASSI